MHISRQTGILLNTLLNDWLPPVARDSYWLNWLITRILYGKKNRVYLEFHQNAFALTPEEFAEVYRSVQDVTIDRETDLNAACLAAILAETQGERVLEVGCGRGFLAAQLAERFAVTAVDHAIDPALSQRLPQVQFRECPAESLPFPDKTFDTVISTHMLEHVRNLPAVIAELRRVCRQRLIVVLPCERPQIHTHTLHLHFFPYAYSLYATFGYLGTRQSVQKCDGDWFYVENMPVPESLS
jgi:ubiquinone/menaquinone biosynthesis C-methylase UbiE